MLKYLVAAAAIASASVAMAQNYGVVVGVQPVYSQTVVPTQQCYQSGPNIPGAIIGGAIGSRFGNGSGRDAMTIFGAIAGSHYGAGQVYCQPSYQTQQNIMYDVVVKTNGFMQILRLPVPPGLGTYITVPIR